MNLDALVAAALDEDLGPGDLTTSAVVDVAAQGSAAIVAKQDVVVSGQGYAARVFALAGARAGAAVSYEAVAPDGERALSGEVIGRVDGGYRGILTGERVALNGLMRLSGVATHVRAWVRAAGPAAPRIVDTRKTTPLWRALEKAAVRHGGGANHRFGLFDGIMIKENHIRAAGGIGAAVHRVRTANHHLVRIEVEVTDLAELDQALAAGADVVMLDNMDDAQLGAAVARARELRPEVLLEASGNMNPERIAGLRGVGIDLVSAGGLIHQARWVDLSLQVER